MKKYIISVLSIISLAFIVFSCDKVDPPYNRSSLVGVSNGRNVLLEELTGHKCPNCPTASRDAHELQIEYPEVILISVHAGSFATPNAAGPFTYDFRSAEGDELNSSFNVSGYPSGIINRKPQDNITVLNASQWTSAIVSFQNDNPVASMQLLNTYDTATRKVIATIRTEFLENYPTPLNMAVYITEDSIIKPQVNNNILVGPTPTITDYVHRHVLRGSFNGAWGSTLTSNAVTYGTIKLNTYSAKLDTVWNDRQCYMVAFITDVATKEVMQVVEKKIR